MQKSKYLLVLFLGIAGVSSAIISSNFKTISVGVNPPTDIELAKKVLVDLNSFYAENPDYEAEVIHSLFSNHTAKSAYESYSGYYKHSKSREHNVLMGFETIQNHICPK